MIMFDAAEGKHRNMLEHTIPEFTWKDWVKPLSESQEL
jgi:hypothetical protein